jgi:hypothetical protein
VSIQRGRILLDCLTDCSADSTCSVSLIISCVALRRHLFFPRMTYSCITLAHYVLRSRRNITVSLENFSDRGCFSWEKIPNTHAGTDVCTPFFFVMGKSSNFVVFRRIVFDTQMTSKQSCDVEKREERRNL